MKLLISSKKRGDNARAGLSEDQRELLGMLHHKKSGGCQCMKAMGHRKSSFPGKRKV